MTFWRQDVPRDKMSSAAR